jgi:hypothetical protein
MCMEGEHVCSVLCHCSEECGFLFYTDTPFSAKRCESHASRENEMFVDYYREIASWVGNRSLGDKGHKKTIS